jgi:hypothetical protein
MKHLPTDEHEARELKQQNAQPWQVDLLALNPAATLWGPEEPMNDPAWEPSGDYTSWADFRQTHETLDDRNELVHFYFEVARPSEECRRCDGTGLSPNAQQMEESFHAGHSRLRLTLDECQALVEQGRFWPIAPVGTEPTKPLVDDDFLERVNAVNGGPTHRSPHDPIERLTLEIDWIGRRQLIEYRCKKKGVAHQCAACDGRGTTYTADAAIVTLYLWLILPAKERSCFVTVAPIERGDLVNVLRFLEMAANRNAERFAGVVRRAEMTYSGVRAE